MKEKKTPGDGGEVLGEGRGGEEARMLDECNPVQTTDHDIRLKVGSG